MSAGSRCHLDDTGNMFSISTCSSYRCGLTLGMVFFRVGGLPGGCSVLVPQLPPTEQRHAHQAKWKSLGESMYGSSFLNEALQLASAFRVKPLCDPDCRISGDKLDGLMGSIVRVSRYLCRWKLHQIFLYFCSPTQPGKSKRNFFFRYNLQEWKKYMPHIAVTLGSTLL